MRKLWKKIEDRKRQKREESVQDLIPVRALDGGVIVTEDLRLVQLLRVSSFNLDLMSYRELYEVMERYELFLRSLSFPVQTTIMSQPVDLGAYIRSLEVLQSDASAVRQELLRGYIAYAKGIETSRTMIQRQRYIVVSESIQAPTVEAYEEAIIQLDEKKKYIKHGLEEMGLTVEEASSLDVTRYLHTLFDYTGSLHRPLEDEAVSPFIIEERLV